MKNLILLLLILTALHCLKAQVQVSELLYREGDRGSSPSGIVEFNGLMFFSAVHASFGLEIWVSNGNIDEAVILKDIYPGQQSSITNAFPNASVVLNDELFFVASDGFSDGEIWKTDGTEEGTVKVTNFLNHAISQLTLVGDRFFFLKRSGTSLQVWKSDGTESGTQLVLGGLTIWNQIRYQGSYNDYFIFTFQESGTNYIRVWRSDGTPEGTFYITDECYGVSSGSEQYMVFEDKLYFTIKSSSLFGASIGLMESDGTYENTVPVKALEGITIANYAGFTITDNKFYLSFYSFNDKRLIIWESDGTGIGTNKIYDQSNFKYFLVSNLVSHEDNLIFCAPNPTGGSSLVKLDLTDNSITYIKELAENPQTYYSNFFYISVDLCHVQRIGSDTFFISAPRGEKAWISELTEASTINIESLNTVTGVFVYNGELYFNKTTQEYGAEPYKSDGTGEGIVMLQNINNSRYGLYLPEMTLFNEMLIFVANDGTIGRELWKMENETVSLLKDIRPGPTSSYPTGFTLFNNELYFTANDSIHGFELWKTNGTTHGTVLVHDIEPGIYSSYPNHLTVHQDELFFFIYIQTSNRHYLVKSNGTDTTMIKNLGANQYDVPFRPVESISSGQYFYYTVVGVGIQLWASDGEENGTQMLMQFSNCYDLTDVDGSLYFVANNGDNGTELWTSTGISGQTHIVKDIGPGYSSVPSNLIKFNDLLFFSAWTEESGRELWRSDGTTAGTFMVADIFPGSESSFRNASLAATENYLYFSANDGVHGFELWKTDGTATGTEMVKDINPGTEGSFPSHLTTINDQIVFQAYDPIHGSEIWYSDGTETGTLLIADLMPGIFSSSPTDMFAVPGYLLLIAETPDHGRQIWKVPFNPVQSVSEIEKDRLSLFSPNPCNDLIYYTGSGLLKELSIFDMQGRLLIKKDSPGNRINVNELKPGIYLIRYNVNGETGFQKLIKNK